VTRRTRLALGLLSLFAFVSGCSDPAPPAPVMIDEGLDDELQTPDPGGDKGPIIESVVRLIRDAATNPNGRNFDVATENLNAFFRDARPEDFDLPEANRAFLNQQLAQVFPNAIPTITQRRFAQRDGRHIEDNLLYRAVAVRVAGEGDDLTRARRLFDYVVKHAMLVPPGALAPPGIQQAQARPYDVLLRGMATEDGNGWSERGWLFMVLCRQINLDCGLITYTPPATIAGPMPTRRGLGPMSLTRAMEEALPPNPEPRSWGVAVLVGGKPYMFDPAIGMEIPSPDGKGVATLEQAMTDPRVLSQLDLPGRPYQPSQVELAASSFRVALESSLGTLSPKMKLFQDNLKGENRMILYRDPLEQVAAFKAAIGPKCAGVGLWLLPLTVEYRLFNPGPGNFVDATLFPLRPFEATWPLLGARLLQLRGETAAAIQSYVVFRFAESAMDTEGKKPIPPQVQGVLDIFATYYLALSQMEKGDGDKAKFLFGKAMDMLPEPTPRQPYFVMFRWGAMTNLGLLNAENGNRALAIRCLAREIPTMQMRGNLLRARALIFKDPFVPPSDTPKVPPPLKMPGAPG